MTSSNPMHRAAIRQRANLDQAYLDARDAIDQIDPAMWQAFVTKLGAEADVDLTRREWNLARMLARLALAEMETQHVEREISSDKEGS